MPKQSSDGYYRSRFYFNGKQYEARSNKSQPEADKKAALMERSLENGEVGASKNMTVQAWCNDWLETFKKGTITDKSYKGYLHRVNDIIVPEIGNLKLKDVRDIHLQKIVNTRKGFSKSDTKKVLQTIRAIFKQARVSRLISYDPAENSLKMPMATEGSNRSITDIERARILKTAETHRAGLWVKMMLYCGLRSGEIIALQWKDIDFKSKRVKIDKALESGSTEIKEPKSKAGNRSVPIPDIFLKDLQAVKSEPFAPVFTQATSGKRHSQDSFYQSWSTFKRQMDIENGAKLSNRKQILISTLALDLIPYFLRHTYCTDLEAAGVPINVAKYLMGHSDISVTSKIYTHTTNEVIDSAAKKINSILNKANL